MQRSRATGKMVCVSAALVACHAGVEGGGSRSGAGTAPSFRVDGVAPWRGDATAAYSIIHDDVCDHGALGVFSAADPELVARGLHAGFGVIAGACDGPGNGTWAQVRTLVAHGHDVFSHSWDHPCMTNDPALVASCDPAAPRSVDFATQISRSRDALRARTGLAQSFFIFPYDVCDPAALAYLRESGFLGARCGRPGTNPAELADPFRIDFDVFGPSYSRYFARDACATTAAGGAPVAFTTTPAEYTDACRLHVLDHYVDETIRARGWGVRELHGLAPDDPGGWETVPLADYRAHLDHLVARVKEGALWVDGPTAILRYALARDPRNCAPPTILSPRTLHFPAQPARCPAGGTPVTYRISTTDGSDPARLQVRQAGRAWPARRVAAGRFVVDADPAGGDASLTAR